MDSIARRTWTLVRGNPVLLCAPLLGADAVSFFFFRADQYLLRRFFPRPDMRVLRAGGHDALPALFSALKMILLGLTVNTCTLILSYGLRAAAYVLTVVIVTQLVRQGQATVSAAFERMQKIPALVSSLLWFGLRVVLIGLGAGLVVAVCALAIPIFIGGIHGGQMTPRISTWILQAALVPGAAIFAYFVTPYFLGLVLHVQGRSFESDLAKARITTRARVYAAAALCAMWVLGVIVARIRIHLGGGLITSHPLVQGAVGLAASLVTTLPGIPVGVAVALLAMNVEEPEAEAERWARTYPVGN